MPKRILYYPTIDIPNEQWIKNTLLYWDEISTIVPYADFRIDPNLELLYEHNCYRPILPETIFRDNRERFLDVLERRLFNLPRHETKCVGIYDEKMFDFHSIKIREIYPEVGQLFDQATHKNGQWHIGANAAMIYMKTLAEFAVQGDQDFVIGTDTRKKAALFDSHHDCENLETSLWFDFVCNECIPMPDKDTSIEQILAFKDTHKRQLIDFQSEFSKLQNSLQTCTSEKEAITHINAFRAKVLHATDLAQRTLKDYAIKYVNGSLKKAVSCLFPSEFLLGCAANAGFLPTLFETEINIDKSLIFTAIGVTAHIGKTAYEDIKEHHQAKKYAYVLQARRMTQSPHKRTKTIG